MDDGRLSDKWVKKCLLFATLVYFIWNKRNARLFKGFKKEASAILNDIRRVVALRYAGIAASQRPSLQGGIDVLR